MLNPLSISESVDGHICFFSNVQTEIQLFGYAEKQLFNINCCQFVIAHILHFENLKKKFMLPGSAKITHMKIIENNLT